MAFLGAVARFIAADKLKTLGQDVLAQGRRRFVEEMARGKSKEDAARVAAKFMLKQAGSRSVSGFKGAARNVLSNAAQASRALRDRLKK